MSGRLPRLHLSGLLGVQTSDSERVPLGRYGFEFLDGTEVFGSYGTWTKSSHTLQLQLTGTAVDRTYPITIA